jgi:DNA topoisomerase I
MAMRRRKTEAPPTDAPLPGTATGRRPKRARALRTLVVAESAARARTLKDLLGPGHTVKAVVGPLRELAPSWAAAPEHAFAPVYAPVEGKQKVLDALRTAASRAEVVLVATAPGVDGEVAAWHVAELLGHPEVRWVPLPALSAGAVEAAFRAPRALARVRLAAEEARAILDRVFSDEVSPLLWKKVRRGLLVGRLPCLALRWVVEREPGLPGGEAAAPWTVEAVVEGGPAGPVRARLHRVEGDSVEPLSREQAEALAAEARAGSLGVAHVERSLKQVEAPPPFCTASLLQEASERLGLSARRTLALAQRLYEGVVLGEEGAVGLVTAVCTDSVRLPAALVGDVRRLVAHTHGEACLTGEARTFAGAGEPEADLAIHPVSLAHPPERVRPQLEAQEEHELLRLYTLIWNRLLASQVRPVVFEETAVELSVGRLTLLATGSRRISPGWQAVDAAGLTAGEGAAAAGEAGGVGGPPELAEGLRLVDVRAVRAAAPAARFTEAALLRELEARGLGPASRCVPVLAFLQERRLVEEVGGVLQPTALGVSTTELLLQALPLALDAAGVAAVEAQLARVARGEEEGRQVVRAFVLPLRAALARADAALREVSREEVPTDVPCDRCGSPMVIRFAKTGSFLACSTHPECKAMREYKEVDGRIVVIDAEEEPTDEVCELCHRPMRVKRGRFGKFLACSGYPECRNSRALSIGVACPDCREGTVTERRSRRGKVFFGCSRYPECAFVAWDRPVAEACPRCHGPYLVQKVSKRDGPSLACPDKACGFRRAVDLSPGHGTPSAA